MALPICLSRCSFQVDFFAPRVAAGDILQANRQRWWEETVDSDVVVQHGLSSKPGSQPGRLIHCAMLSMAEI